MGGGRKAEHHDGDCEDRNFHQGRNTEYPGGNLAGRLNSAIDDLSSALSFARSRKAGLENEARILADLANAYRLNGDSAAALATVNEAIEVATARHARVAECFARIVHSEILSKSMSDDQKAEGVRELSQARALMQETGALLFDALINGADESPDSRHLSTKGCA